MSSVRYPAGFFSNVDKCGPVPEHAPHLGRCWVWKGRVSRLGYGQFGRSYGGKFSTNAHRRHWVEMNGPLPHDADLDHLCRNRACVRLEHLEPVSHSENCRRGLNGALHRKRTHCKRGHRYPFDDSTYCRECNRLKMRARRGSTGIAHRSRTSCPQGHPYDSVGGHGERACSICLKEQKRASYLRAKGRKASCVASILQSGSHPVRGQAPPPLALIPDKQTSVLSRQNERSPSPRLSTRCRI